LSPLIYIRWHQSKTMYYVTIINRWIHATHMRMRFLSLWNVIRFMSSAPSIICKPLHHTAPWEDGEKRMTKHGYLGRHSGLADSRVRNFDVYWQRVRCETWLSTSIFSPFFREGYPRQNLHNTVSTSLSISKHPLLHRQRIHASSANRYTKAQTFSFQIFYQLRK
jgi:hypothetical protein